ncbi:MAG: hypothetical protein LW860_17725 [Xanthomonadaceae bacterium]|jgi:hypothetical protein|nr:hypothetical protein [Xanthomonadaceae bacterium]
MPRIARRLAAPVLLALALAACGDAPAPAPPQPAGNSAQAQQDLDAFRQLIAAGSDEFAVTMGREVLRKHPGSPAAAEVAAALPAAEQRAKAKADAKRLAALWTYLTNDLRGVRQHTASIHSSVPGSAAERVRLILRRHVEWGQSVYLFDGDGSDRSRKGFVCGKACRLPARIDGVAVALAAHSPETGEPALFIDDDAGFIARLAGGAKTIEIDLRHATRGPFTAVFEVGGYDDPKFLRDP